MQCIDGCHLDTGPARQRLRLLQDICSLSTRLPKLYWVNDVSRGRRIAIGGETTVYKARYRSSDAVVREFHPPPHNDWDDDEGKSVFTVSRFTSAPPHIPPRSSLLFLIFVLVNRA